MSDVTRLLEAMDQSESREGGAAEELLLLVYEELRRLASARMAAEPPGQTLQPTALVHEAWLKLVGSGRERWPDSRHFVAAAAEAMRRIVVDRARRKATRKHGGQQVRVELEAANLAAPATDENLVRVDEALTRLAEEDPQSAEIVKLRFFVGLTTAETARALGISWPVTAEGYNLFGAESVEGPWGKIDAAVTVEAGRSTVTVKANERMRFYQLRIP